MTLSRREFLTGVLGATCLAGCEWSQGDIALPPGELVGASADVGHRLRNMSEVRVPTDRWQDVDVVIVGGGVAGLSAARQLRKAGVEKFVVLELEPHAGGTARGGETAVVPCPWGAHYLPAPTAANQPLVELLSEMNLIEGFDDFGDPVIVEQQLCRDPQERLFLDGVWLEGLYPWGGDNDDAVQFARFRSEMEAWAGRRDAQGRRAFAVPMALASDDAEVMALDQLTMDEWLQQRGFDSPRLRWYVDYACRDDYGLHVEHASGWAGIFYFASRMPEPGRPTRPFITWPEGNGRLVQQLSRNLGERLQTGWAVTEVAPSADADGSSRIEVTAVAGAGDDVQGWRAKRVIMATPRLLDRYLIRDWRRHPPAHLQDFTYSAWAVANLTLSGRPTETDFPLCWDNVIHDSPSLGYVTATHQALLDYGPTVLTWYYPLCDDDGRSGRERLFAGGRDDWADAALMDIEQAHPEIRQLTTRVDVARWGHAMIRPTPGFVSGVSRKAAAVPYRGIHFAQTDLSGLPLFEEAFYRGNTAADAVLQELQASV